MEWRHVTAFAWRIFTMIHDGQDLQLPMEPVGISAIQLSNGDIQLDVEKSKERYQFNRN